MAEKLIINRQLRGGVLGTFDKDIPSAEPMPAGEWFNLITHITWRPSSLKVKRPKKRFK